MTTRPFLSWAVLHLHLLWSPLTVSLAQLPKVNVEQLIAKATELYSGDLQELQVKTKQLSPT
jgi:DNA-directed RNA polymerase subunit H (RpoH/RPB5)